MKTGNTREPLNALRALCRYETHGGYVWAAVMSDGELLCVKCARENYREIFTATRDGLHTGWAIAGLANSGESESLEHCAHCNATLWGEEERTARDPTLEDMRAFVATMPFADEFTDFDIEAAIYWFANDWHGGQDSNLYSALSRSEFHPGPLSHGPEPESIEADIYDALVKEFTS